jgi:hypothetical protein
VVVVTRSHLGCVAARAVPPVDAGHLNGHLDLWQSDSRSSCDLLLMVGRIESRSFESSVCCLILYVAALFLLHACLANNCLQFCLHTRLRTFTIGGCW